MAFTMEQIASGIRNALYGREVREWLALLGETCVKLTKQAIDAASGAKASEEAAKKSEQNAKASKEAAEKSAGKAADSAAAAKGSAEAAEKSAKNAKGSEESAKSYSEKAKDAINDARNDYSGGYYKTYNLTALQTAWKPLEEAIGPYRYYCDIEVAELTDRYTPFCTTSLETHVEAVTAGVAAGIETRNGCVRLFSILIPTGDVQLLLTLYGVGTLNYELTLPTGSWVKGESAFGVYPYYCDIPVKECTSALIPMGLTSLSEFEEAEKAGLATVMETKTGCLRFFAYTAPQKNIDVNVSLLKKEEPVNTPATRTELGLVMIGDGLDVSSAGSVTSRVASDKEFDAMMKQIYGS